MNSYRILVVDDEPNNLKLIQQILKDHYQLLFAINGKLAVEAAIQHLPDLILLDIMMPEMSGFEVCEKLKKHPETEDIPIIFISAMEEVEKQSLPFQLGEVKFISKPISVSSLQENISSILDTSAT